MLTQQLHALSTLVYYRLVIHSNQTVQPAQNQLLFVDLWIAHKKPHQQEQQITNFGAKLLLIQSEIIASMMQDQLALQRLQQHVLSLYQLEQLMEKKL